MNTHDSYLTQIKEARLKQHAELLARARRKRNVNDCILWTALTFTFVMALVTLLVHDVTGNGIQDVWDLVCYLIGGAK